MPVEEHFEPVIVGFTCNWCSYRAADGAGVSRIKYAPNVRLIRLMCSGRLDPQFVLKALAEGADGVLISGCHPGDCHYVDQNIKTLRRFELLQKTLTAMGIEPGRLKLIWASAAEGILFAEEINTMVAEVKALGPLRWKQIARQEEQPEVLFEA
jgi:F420-non-reducing hydrogenase iron-sulfur subunit